MRVLEATDSWNYSTAAWRQMNNSAANQLDFVRGLDVDSVTARVTARASNSTSTPRTAIAGIGLDVTNAFAAGCLPGIGRPTDTVTPSFTALYSGLPGIGRRILTALEYGGGGDTQTWSGDGATPTVSQSGIIGEVMA